MKALWAIEQLHTEAERTQAVAFAAELGCNTLITGDATAAMVRQGQAHNIRVIATVVPGFGGDFAQTHPQAGQKMRDFEQQVAEAMVEQSWLRLHGESFRWQSFILTRPMLCFAQPESQAELKKQVERALEIADGIALDGFGFTNYYACFCPHCTALRGEKKRQNPALSEVEVMAEVSKQTLINIHRLLHDHAKAIKPAALVTNHVWPMFLPDEYLAAQYKLDYCTQTISWFYPPEWPLERVEMEAAALKRLEDPACNRFVPFIGIIDQPGLLRRPERLAGEIEIALKYGQGRLVLSRLTTLQNHPELAAVVKQALNQ